MLCLRPPSPAGSARLFYGGRRPANASDAFRNVGQLEWTGTRAAPLPFGEPPPEPVELDQRELPWELREEAPDRN